MELKAVKRKGALESVLALICYLSSPLMLSAIFVTMHLLGWTVSAQTIFVTMATARIFEFTASMLPRSIAEIVGIINSIKRIQKFLLTEEIDNENYDIKDLNDDDPTSIAIVNGNFYSETIQ
jgi:hypothetical protein